MVRSVVISARGKLSLTTSVSTDIAKTVFDVPLSLFCPISSTCLPCSFPAGVIFVGPESGTLISHYS